MSELPAGWVITPLGNLLRAIEAGLNVKCEERPPVGDEAGLVKISAVTWGRFNEEASKTLPRDTSLNERNRIRAGDLLISRANTIELVGASVIVGPISKRLYLSDKVLRLVVDDPAKRWINYALKTPQLRRAIQEASTGNQLSMRNVPQEKLRSLSIPLAPGAEQTRIADQLDSLLARVNDCNAHLDAIPGILKRFRQVVLNACVAPDLLEATFEVPFRVVRLLDVLVEPLRNGKSVRDGSGIPVLRLTSLKSSGIDLKETKAGDWSNVSDIKRFLIQDGDYLVSRGNGSKELVGRGGLVSQCNEEIAFPDTMIRVRPDHTELSPDYLKYVWASRFVREQIERAAKTTAGIWKVSQPDLENIRIPLPRLKEQREIVCHVDVLLRVADRIEMRYAAIRAHVQRLAPQVLAKAFRGELVEQDPQDEPASALLQRMASSQPNKASASRGRPRTQAKPQPPAPDRPPTDWPSLPDGAWVSPADPDGHATSVWLTAVLRAWGAPMPERTARLATLLCEQPHLFTPTLPAAQARLWSRLVGDAAAPLPAQVSRLQPAANHPWGRALQSMRMRGDLIEAGTGDDVTWALGPGAAAIATAGWPDGRAGFVVAHLRAHGLASILPALAPAAQAFVDARAA